MVAQKVVQISQQTMNAPHLSNGTHSVETFSNLFGEEGRILVSFRFIDS
jgi:hypothetical protein